MRKIGKIELINNIASKTGYTKKDTAAILKAICSEISTEISHGNDVMIPDFGAFRIQSVKARKGRNIATGKAITIPKRKRIKFTASNKFTNAIKQ